MQRLEVSCAVRRIYTVLGAKGLIYMLLLTEGRADETWQYSDDAVSENSVELDRKLLSYSVRFLVNKVAPGQGFPPQKNCSFFLTV